MPDAGGLRAGAGQADGGLPPAGPVCDPHAGSRLAGRGAGEAALLASCYRSCLLLAEAHSIRTLDFCSISTGVYGYPLPLAATVALRAIMDFLADHALPERVRMVCHSEQAAEVYRRTWNLWYAEGKDQRM